jgi:hypothetical protein
MLLTCEKPIHLEDGKSVAHNGSQWLSGRLEFLRSQRNSELLVEHIPTLLLAPADRRHRPVSLEDTLHGCHFLLSHHQGAKRADMQTQQLRYLPL